MNKKTILLLLVIGVAVWQAWTRDPSIKAPNSGVKFGYVVHQAGDAGGKDRLPILVALHGNGDTAEHFYETALNQVSVPARVILLKGPLSYGTGAAWPWTSEDYLAYGDAVNEVIVELARKYPTTGKPMLIGFSGGAGMAYYQAARHGDSYSSIFAVSGRLSENMLDGEVVSSNATVFAYHGKGDSVIPIGGGKHAVRMLQTSGVNAQLTEFEGGHLGIFGDMKLEITQAVERELERIVREY